VGGQACWPQTDTLTAGMIVDVIPGSALETVLGSNIATLTAGQVNNEITGSDGQRTSNVSADGPTGMTRPFTP
jgi:hypothetical protein